MDYVFHDKKENKMEKYLIKSIALFFNLRKTVY